MATALPSQSLEDLLLRLPCHFSWKSLQTVGRTVQMNIENLEEHMDEAIQGTEVKSYNLMGFYKTQQEKFEEAKANFEKALEYSDTEYDRIVSIGCLAWLTWKQSGSDSSSDKQVVEMINQVQNILAGRNPEEIPEVMAEKGFAIANSGFTEKGFQEALDCIDKALEKRSDDVMYKFTKAIILQQFYQNTYKKETKGDADAQKIKQLWKELIASLETNSRYPVLYGLSLVQYALFLGRNGEEYAKKAEDVGRSHQATAVMRNVAKFYTKLTWENERWTQKDILMVNKAEKNIEDILELKPDGDYKTLTGLAHIFFQRYKMVKTSPDANFAKAEKHFRKAWDLNDKYSPPALELARLYQLRYDKTKDGDALKESEKILHALVFKYEGKEDLDKAIICSAFGCFIKKYGQELASVHRRSCPGYQSASVTSPAIKEARQLIHVQYRQDKKDEHLLQADQIFRQLYTDLTKQRNAVKARFIKVYTEFLDNYSNDLAFCYLNMSLDLNPHQGYAYRPLEELARDKKASTDKKEQIKGRRTLERIAQLRKSNQ